MVDWKGMGATWGKMKDTEATNVLKMVHGWQNDGYQKDLFDEVGREYLCPVGLWSTGGMATLYHM